MKNWVLIAEAFFTISVTLGIGSDIESGILVDVTRMLKNFGVLAGLIDRPLTTQAV